MPARVTLIAFAAAVQCGCYGPVEDRSTITSTAVLDCGRVALVYHAYSYRPATGLAAFPDGGIPIYQKDDFTIAVAAADGSVRKLAEFHNDALPGSGSVTLIWRPEDPAYVYAFRGGQLDYASHYLSDELRIRLEDGTTEHLKLANQFAANGRELGADGFGTLTPLDGSGTMLVGATHGERKELWLRTATARLRKLADFDRFERVVGPDIVYSVDGPPFTTYALNWRTGAVRTIMRYKVHTTGLNWHDFDAKDDPAYQALNRPQPPSSNPDHVEVDRTTLTYFEGDRPLWSRQVRF